jgi:hypothetical protein
VVHFNLSLSNSIWIITKPFLWPHQHLSLPLVDLIATVALMVVCAWREKREWPMPLKGKVLQILLQHLSLPSNQQCYEYRHPTPCLYPTWQPPQLAPARPRPGALKLHWHVLILKMSPSTRTTSPPASPTHAWALPSTHGTLPSSHRPLSTATWEPTCCRTPGRHPLDISSPRRPTLPCRVLSPSSTPHSHGHAGAVSMPLLVPISLATLATHSSQWALSYATHSHACMPPPLPS